jgi:SAM-dependent methyltransferase
MPHSDFIGGAYNVIADEYDELLSRDRSVRRVLWGHHARLFKAGDRVMDVGCGTGLDTLQLASRGVRVTAVDGSTGMITRLRAKLAGTPFAGLVTTEVGDIIEVTSRLSGPYDGIISSFAALNTVDLQRFATIAAGLLRPGGRAVLHLLSPGRGHERRSWTVDIGGRPVTHECLRAEETYQRFFARDFDLRRRYALGILTRDEIIGRVPAPLTDLLARLESVVGGMGPLVNIGRFFVLDLQSKRKGG